MNVRWREAGEPEKEKKGRGMPRPARIESKKTYCVQVGRAPQAMPWALKASQLRQALGVPLARLPASSSAGRNTVYQLVAPQPLAVAAGLHLPPAVTW